VNEKAPATRQSSFTSINLPRLGSWQSHLDRFFHLLDERIDLVFRSSNTACRSRAVRNAIITFPDGPGGLIDSDKLSWTTRSAKF
jgi:hypothetical protein